MRNGVKFNNYHSLDDLGLIFNTKVISEPVAQTKLVKIPSRNGALDLSEVLSGSVRYNNRTITMRFTITDNVNNWESIRQEIASKLHGERMQIVFDDDEAFYWLGRVEVGDLKPSKSCAELTIKANVEPYKYNITTSIEDWLWNPFDFENGVINELYGLTVNGSLEVKVIGLERWENPIIICSEPMTVDYKGNTYNLKAGSQVLYEIIIEEGENILTFHGNGTVSVNYRGGSL